MSLQKIPAEVLQQSKKILFIAHLAIGDFSYLQNCFRAFAQAFPHLEMHLWVDEVRRTKKAELWPILEKYSLYDWVENCDLFSKVYRRTYSPDLFKESILEARQEDYSIVVSLSNIRSHKYAALARKVGPKAFVAGIKQRINLFQPLKFFAYTKLDAAIQANRHADSKPHISAIYADWFEQLAGITTTEEQRFPYVTIPEKWLQQARLQLDEWDFHQGKNKVIFINPFAKTNKRCWPLQRVGELIKAIQKQEAWRNACFVVNAPPEKLEHLKNLLSTQQLKNTQFFSAQDNFFQLPAVLSWCDLIISVETAVMHLANAVHVPVIALMRQKNPEWTPFDSANSKVITTEKRSDWVDAITVDQVLEQLNTAA